ncbi:MAG TPA: cytochrome b/b6 domain-containing protein [Caulobacterales bacterium]|nr:cytochrome b/b6 domain-containing protein [Caulobacterales bacterium]
MQWANTKQSYGWVSIAFHWLGALGVLTMLYIGLSAGWAEDAGNQAQHRALMAVHTSLGTVLVAFLLLRIILHYTQKQIEVPDQSRLLTLAASWTHNLLLLAVLLLIVSGPLMLWTAGRPLNFGGLFQIPSPFTRNREIHEVFEKVHAVGRFALYVLIPLHVLGALKHLILDRDTVFQRMLTPRKAQ